MSADTSFLAEVLGIPEKVDRFALEGKAALAKLFQDLTAVIDSLGLCLFTSFALKADDYRDLYNAITGADWTTADLLTAGERIWNLERLFNLAAGIDPSEDTASQTVPRRAHSRRPLQGARASARGTLAAVLPGARLGCERHPHARETRGPGTGVKRIPTEGCDGG